MLGRGLAGSVQTGLRARQAGPIRAAQGCLIRPWLGCITGDPAIGALALLTYPWAQSRLSRIPSLQDR